ncbi:glucosamine-6-phosphate deaminase [Pseudooceanicola sp. CBS1P-1]|uniref:Glucosamine-6-phosphate deaminase n=1 Tax=Pseudooceanicola albus TaxID=2692189 RepID=A0A6L7G569_9RHOB|nr:MULTISPECIES: glucosamine-6-phosphate deaminase [Pseudooceanicola]MBT9385198.1 glucosamine-6-phosphate deaminase [Pseudooceanicola endophyticus]MXN18510.1 glucosamine-6-phosphate deaminase [Pseudooceanicola albus]
MRILIEPSAEQAVSRTVGLIAEQMHRNPASVLGLATGGTMEAVYAGLIEAHRAGGLSFAGARSFNLDEYVGLSGAHPQSYRHYMQDRLFRHVDFPRGATHLPRGDAEDPVAAAQQYEARIAAEGPIDLQLLGLGTNGHIGFNEPTSSLASRSRVTCLAPSTLEANSRFFGPGEPQPGTAITMGIGTILEARRIVLLATGAAKAEAAAAMIEGPLSAFCPASALQMHTDATVVLDEAAAARLTQRAFYLWVARQDPDGGLFRPRPHGRMTPVAN